MAGKRAAFAYLTYPAEAVITVTFSRGIAPHSALPKQHIIELSGIITRRKQKSKCFFNI
jgi:hypothetical protein